MSILAIDVETAPDESKVKLFTTLTGLSQDRADSLIGLEGEEYTLTYDMLRAQQMALTPEYATVVGMNYMAEDLPSVSRWVGEVVPSKLKPEMTVTVTEQSLLRLFWQLAGDSTTIVTFNGLAFDLEVIKVRSAFWSLRPSLDLTNLKPWENRHVDLMKRMFANRKPMKLKVLRALYWASLLEHEPALSEYGDLKSMEGDEIYNLYLASDFETLKKYGEFDALTTMALYKFGKGLWW